MNRQHDPSPTIPMIAIRLFTPNKPDLQVRAGAEHAAVAGHDDAFDAIVGVEEGEGFFHFGHEGGGEGVVVVGAVEGEDDDGGRGRGAGGVVGEFDLGVGEGGVGGGEGEFADVGVAGHGCCTLWLGGGRRRLLVGGVCGEYLEAEMV